MPTQMQQERSFDNGDILSINEFSEMVEAGVISDNDGTGYFATDSRVLDIHAIPSMLDEEVVSRAKLVRAKYVVWYNK